MQKEWHTATKPLKTWPVKFCVVDSDPIGLETFSNGGLDRE
jgi:hypothetical protein